MRLIPLDGGELPDATVKSGVKTPDQVMEARVTDEGHWLYYLKGHSQVEITW